MKGLIIIFLMLIVCIVMYLVIDHSKSVKQEENSDDEMLEKITTESKKDTNENIVSMMVEEFIENKAEIVSAVERNVLDNKVLLEEEERFLEKYNLSDEDKKNVINEFETFIWGYGPLQSLIDDKDISDISIIDENTVRIKVLGQRKTSNVKFKSKEELNEYIKFVALKNKVTLSEINSLPIATDTNSSDKFILRIDISNEFVNCGDNSYLHIRKIPKLKDTIEGLKSKNMFDEDIEKYLVKCVKNKLGILVCGKGGSGKTTLLNALIELIPYDCSGLIVQESSELFSHMHPDLRFQRVISSHGEGNVEYTLSYFIRKYALVSDPDYIVVGEIKGEEAWDSVNASFTGHNFMGALHVLNSREALPKVVHYMKYSPYSRDMTKSELMETLTGIDVIIFMKDFKVNEVTEVSGFDDIHGKMLYNPVFKYKKGKFLKLNESCDKIKEKEEYNEFENSRVE